MTDPTSPPTPPAPPAPAPPQQAPAQPPAAPGAAPLDRDQVTGAAARAGIGYAAALCGGIVATVVGTLTSWGGSGSDGGLGGGASDLAAPFVLASTGLFGTLDVSGSGDGAGGGMTLVVTPLWLTLLAFAGVWGWSLWRPVRVTSVRDAWTTSLVAGGVLGVGAAILAAVFRVSASDESGGASIHANPFLTLLGGLVIGTLGAAAGAATRTVAGRPHLDLRRLGLALLPALRRATVAAALGYGAAGVLVALGALVWLAAEQGVGAALLVGSLLGVNVAALGLGLGGFGGLELSGSMFGSGGSATGSLFSDGTPGLLWLLFLAVLAGTAATAVLLARHVAPGHWRSAWATPTVLAVGSLATTLLAGGRATVHVDALVSVSGSGHAILAPWTFVVAALWGGLAEVLARTIVPALASGRPSGADADAAGAAPRLPVSRRAAVITLASAGGLVLVVGGAVVARNVVNGAAHGPEHVALAYVEALRDGKPSTAFAVADPDLEKDRRALLTDAVYGKVEDRPSSVRVRHVDVDGDSAAVTVAFDVGGTKTTQTLSLHKDGHEDVVFDHWVLDAPDVPSVSLDLGQVVASGDAGAGADAAANPVTILVDGHKTQVDPDDPRLALLPGRWTVTLPDAGPYLAASTVTYLVTADEGRDTGFGSGSREDRTLTYTVTDAALREAEKQESARLDACFASTEAEPDGCPNDAFVWADDAQDGHWLVATKPSVTASASEWEPGRITVESTGGEASYAYTLPKSKEHYRTKTEHKTWQATSLDDRATYTVVDGKVVPVDEY